MAILHFNNLVEGYLHASGTDYGGHAWNTYFDGKNTYYLDVVNNHSLEKTIKDCTYTPNL